MKVLKMECQSCNVLQASVTHFSKMVTNKVLL